jgi:hypothetical protein
MNLPTFSLELNYIYIYIYIVYILRIIFAIPLPAWPNAVILSFS